MDWHGTSCKLAVLGSCQGRSAVLDSGTRGKSPCLGNMTASITASSSCHCQESDCQPLYTVLTATPTLPYSTRERSTLQVNYTQIGSMLYTKGKLALGRSDSGSAGSQGEASGRKA